MANFTKVQSDKPAIGTYSGNVKFTIQKWEKFPIDGDFISIFARNNTATRLSLERKSDIFLVVVAGGAIFDIYDDPSLNVWSPPIQFANLDPTTFVYSVLEPQMDNFGDLPIRMKFMEMKRVAKNFRLFMVLFDRLFAENYFQGPHMVSPSDTLPAIARQAIISSFRSWSILFKSVTTGARLAELLRRLIVDNLLGGIGNRYVVKLAQESGIYDDKLTPQQLVSRLSEYRQRVYVNPNKTRSLNESQSQQAKKRLQRMARKELALNPNVPDSAIVARSPPIHGEYPSNTRLPSTSTGHRKRNQSKSYSSSHHCAHRDQSSSSSKRSRRDHRDKY